ncbi:MAG: response regulator transcription factor [Acidimicrobiia bacterium]
MVGTPRVLVVEDELKIARLVEDYLVEAGFDVLTAPDGKSAVAVARSERPDLVILDIGLPGMDGYDVTRSIRASAPTPIIMLTARGEETDRVIGLELGADDYIAKPFSPRELVARVKAVLRRTTGQVTSEVIRVKDLAIDVPRRRVERAGEGIELTATEFEILRLLAARAGQVFTRGQMLDAVRGVSFESYERSIDAHVKNIRKKLEPDPRHPRYLETVHGIGYRFADA